MASNVESLLLRLDATSESLRKELKRADAATGEFQRKTDRHMRQVEGSMGRIDGAARIATRALGALGVGLSIGALTGFIRRTTEAADVLATTAARIGVTVEHLQEMRFAARRTDVSVNGLEQSLERYGRRLGEAQQGTGELLKITTQYGIALRTTDGAARGSETVLRDLADAIQNAESHQEKLRIANQAFGRSGAEMILLLQHGAEGLDKYGQAARDAGLVLSGAGINQLAEFNDRLDLMGERTSAASTSLVIALLPALEETVTWFEKAAAGAGYLVERFTAIENLGLGALQRRAAELREIIENAEAGIGLEALNRFGGGLDKAKADLAEVEGRIESISTGKVAPTGGNPLGGLPAATALANDNLADLQAQLDRSRKAFDALVGGGTDAFEAMKKSLDVQSQAEKLAGQFNKTNAKLIESGQIQARTAAQYRDVLGEIADVQDQTNDRKALDDYIAGLTEEHAVAKARLELGEDEARVQGELNKLRAAGVTISEDSEAVIRKTAAATAALNKQFDAQQAAIKDASKAAEAAAALWTDTWRNAVEDVQRSASDFPDDLADDPRMVAIFKEALQ